MAKHKLSGSFIEQCDCNVIPFLDTSNYIEGKIPENPILKIYPPNWKSYINIPYNLNAITLIKPSLIKHSILPSGVYHITQSICPNDKLFMEYCYLHICPDLKCLTAIVCENIDDEDTLEEVFNIKMQLEVAQLLVKEGETTKGIELYNVSVDQLKSLKKNKNCNC